MVHPYSYYRKLEKLEDKINQMLFIPRTRETGSVWSVVRLCEND